MADKPKGEARYRADVASVLSDLLGKLPGVREGRVLGRPAFFAGTTLFAFVYRDGVVVKLPEAKVEQLVGRPGFLPFQMKGKPKMREWVEVRRGDPAAYAEDIGLFREAVAFVSASQAAPTKAKSRRR